MNALRTLVVDDELLARRRLTMLLADEPDVEVVAECENGEEAVAAIEAHAPDLVLTITDDGRGFDPAAAGEGGGHGQRTMQERAMLCGGSAHVDSAPGRGTRLVVRVPLST